MVKRISSTRKVIWTILLVIVIIIVVVLIKNDSNNSKELKLTENVYKLVIDYSDKYNQFNTFIIKATPKQIINDKVIESGFFIGPGYKDMLNDCKLTMFCNIKNKRIYFISDMSNLFEMKADDKWNNTNAPDSIILSDDQKIVRNADALFIHRAIFFNFDNNGDLKVNYQPDSIFAPKYLGTTIKFENVQDTTPRSSGYVKKNRERW